MARYWIEVLLPLYSVAAVLVYLRPHLMPVTLHEGGLQSLLTWAGWALVGALTGVLAVSALFLSFYLVYSPIYLATQIRRLAERGTWVDRREVRFYLWCFLVLCVLGSLALVSPTAAIVAFVLLAGSAQLLWRALV